MSHHQTYYVTSSDILCHIIRHTNKLSLVNDMSCNPGTVTGYGMFGFRPIVPISTFLIFGAVAMAWFMIFSNRR